MPWTGYLYKDAVLTLVYVQDYTFLPGAYNNAWGFAFFVYQLLKFVVSHNSIVFVMMYPAW